MVNSKILRRVCMLFFIIGTGLLAGCNSSDSDNSTSKTTKDDTTVKEETPSKSTEINVLVNQDFLDNFSLTFAKETYFNQTMSQACVDVTITKKTNFKIRNTFKLTLVVSKVIELDYGNTFTYKYIDSAQSISESSFSNSKCIINWPITIHGQFDFNNSIYKKQIGVASLG